MELFSLSKNEKDGVSFDNELDFSLSCLQKRALKAKKMTSWIFTIIFGMVECRKCFMADAEQRQMYFDSYIDTYLMRDVAELGGITDASRFRKFMTACAALKL